MRFMVIRKFKMSFEVAWHTECRCSGGGGGGGGGGGVWCSIMFFGGHGQLSNHYIISSIDLAVRYL